MTTQFSKTYCDLGEFLTFFLLLPNSVVLAVSRRLSKAQDGGYADSEGPLLHMSVSCSHVSKRPRVHGSKLHLWRHSSSLVLYDFVVF